MNDTRRKVIRAICADLEDLLEGFNMSLEKIASRISDVHDEEAICHGGISHHASAEDAMDNLEEAQSLLDGMVMSSDASEAVGFLQKAIA